MHKLFIKKIIAGLLAGLLLISLAACAGNAAGPANPTSDQTTTSSSGGKASAATDAVKILIEPPAGWEPVTGSVLPVQYLKETASFMVKEESLLSGKLLDEAVEQALQVLGNAFKDMTREGDIETITVDGKDARLVVFICTVSKIAMKFEYVYLIAGGKFYAITFGDTAAHFDAAAEDYALILQNIRFESAGSVSPEATTKAVATTAGQTGKQGNLLSRDYIELMKSGKYLIHYKVTNSMAGESMTAEITTAVDGETIAATMVAEGAKTRSLIKDGAAYLIDDENKTYMKMDLGSDMPLNESEMFENTADLAYVGSGTDKVDGRSLPYEEYGVEGETLRFYMDGKTLYAITSKTGADLVEMVILEFTDKIPDGMMDLPEGYEENDFTAMGDAGETDEED